MEQFIHYLQLLSNLGVMGKVFAYLAPVLFAITLHEAAHAWMAKRCGDNTAFMLGRVTLNPIKHIDPVGTIALPLLSLFLGGFLFGWARPVPVNTNALKDPKNDMFWVSLAGPAANLIMAVAWIVVFRVLVLLGMPSSGQAIALMAVAGVSINISLMIFNLLPIPPLDGSKMLFSFFPKAWDSVIAQLEQYSMIILIVVMTSGVLSPLLGGLWRSCVNLLGSLFL